MTPNQPHLNMTSTFLTQGQQQQTSSSGDHAVMSMLSSRQHSKLTANIYGTQNNNVNVAGMMSQQQQQQPPQPQRTKDGNNVINSGAINSIANGHGNTMNINVVNNNIINNSSTITNTTSSTLPQQQVQIAGLNGISFTLPQPVFSQVGVALPQSLSSSNGTIDALTLSSLNGSVPEFLYQLTKMLTDEGNKEVIEWNAGMRYGGVQVSGRIEVHNPKRMEEEVLGKYFRHSKYASFQRQLNYFGFRKIAGKGKMSPCSYINDMATSDIRSLLLIKRKGAVKNGGADEEATTSSGDSKTCTSDYAKSADTKTASSSKKRPSNAHIHRPVSVMAVGPPPTFLNGKSSVSTVSTGDHIKKVKIDPSSIDNQYINITDNDAFGFVANNNNSSSNSYPSTTTAQDSLTNAYNMALGQGVKQHQFNNYLKMDFNNNSSHSTASTVISNTPSAAPSAYSTTTTVASTTSSASSTTHSTSNNNNFNSYLAYPSSQHAVSVPAPLQFLDPSELGMSIESSLNELKSNFNAANNANNVAAAAQASAPSAQLPTYTVPTVTTDNKPGLMAVNTAPFNGSVTFAANGMYFPNTPSMASNYTGTDMLSRDDSLVNLAMLPMMESGVDLTSYNTSFNNGNGGGLLHCDDSLIALAASVDQTNNGNMMHHNHAAGNYGTKDDDSTDMFSFIDFPGQT